MSGVTDITARRGAAEDCASSSSARCCPFCGWDQPRPRSRARQLFSAEKPHSGRKRGPVRPAQGRFPRWRCTRWRSSIGRWSPLCRHGSYDGRSGHPAGATWRNSSFQVARCSQRGCGVSSVLPSTPRIQQDERMFMTRRGCGAACGPHQASHGAAGIGSGGRFALDLHSLLISALRFPGSSLVPRQCRIATQGPVCSSSTMTGTSPIRWSPS